MDCVKLDCATSCQSVSQFRASLSGSIAMRTAIVPSWNQHQNRSFVHIYTLHMGILNSQSPPSLNAQFCPGRVEIGERRLTPSLLPQICVDSMQPSLGVLYRKPLTPHFFFLSLSLEHPTKDYLYVSSNHSFTSRIYQITTVSLYTKGVSMKAVG